MQDLITEAMNMFDSYEKWNAFIELSNSKNAMRQRFYEKFKEAMLKKFGNEGLAHWRFYLPHNEQYRWYLSEFSENHVCVLWRPDDLILWYSNQLPAFTTKARELFNTPKYKPILDCFDRPYSFKSYLHHFCEQKHLYNLGNELIYSAMEDPGCENLTWLVGNMTDAIVGEIEKQVNKFRTPEITQLLLDLNRECQEAVGVK